MSKPRKLTQYILGAVVLVALAVILIPMLNQKHPEEHTQQVEVKIPPPPPMHQSVQPQQQAALVQKSPVYHDYDLAKNMYHEPAHKQKHQQTHKQKRAKVSAHTKTVTSHKLSQTHELAHKAKPHPQPKPKAVIHQQQPHKPAPQPKVTRPAQPAQIPQQAAIKPMPVAKSIPDPTESPANSMVTTSLPPPTFQEGNSKLPPVENLTGQTNSQQAGMAKPHGQAVYQTPSAVHAVPHPALNASAHSISQAVSQQGTFVVQLASFSNLSNAQFVLANLRSKSFKGFLVTEPHGQGQVARVYVGPYQSRQAAEKAVQQLKKAMAMKGLVEPYKRS